MSLLTIATLIAAVCVWVAIVIGCITLAKAAAAGDAALAAIHRERLLEDDEP